MWKLAITGALAAAATLGAGGVGHAQERVSVNVGTITSTQTCAYFRNYSGSRLRYSEAEYARWWGAAAARNYYLSHTTWSSWVYKDCQTNFQNLRNTVEGALASTGRLTTGRGGYTLDITISDIGQTPPANSRPVRGENSYRTSWGTATATVSFTLKDSAGRNIDGGVLTKRIEMSRTLNTDTLRVRTSEPGASVYDLMQNEVALSLARDVTFAIDPMRVVGVEGDLIEINYGRPMLQLGDRLDVKKTRGIGSLRYRVISASETDAVAEIDGNNDTSDIEPGNTVTFIEKDSDAANARRLQGKRIRR
ncbi:hypothetical protein [Erythrobacter sp. F6033]|uniref:hypothetical protein n=1 Tax=Erythrobacter sp. F6033 TaxID=2926401 RepID=UPI001FF5F07E|nr:hypothetical protein [Erythrobacter sp. F6033]MCK0128174.1 hypothetical protein [Erythrobacter sp. F6033]